MVKVLKWGSSLLGILFVLFLAVMIMITTCISPNRFKPLIVNAFSHHGLDLKIVGDLSWSFYPLTVRTGQTEWGIPSLKKSVVAKNARFSASLGSLLHGKIQLSRFGVDGMDKKSMKDWMSLMQYWGEHWVK